MNNPARWRDPLGLSWLDTVTNWAQQWWNYFKTPAADEAAAGVPAAAAAKAAEQLGEAGLAPIDQALLRNSGVAAGTVIGTGVDMLHAGEAALELARVQKQKKEQLEAYCAAFGDMAPAACRGAATTKCGEK